MASKTVTITDIRIERCTIQPPDGFGEGRESTELISIIDYSLFDADGKSMGKRNSWLWENQLSEESKKVCKDYHDAMLAGIKRIEKMT